MIVKISDAVFGAGPPVPSTLPFETRKLMCCSIIHSLLLDFRIGSSVNISVFGLAVSVISFHEAAFPTTVFSPIDLFSFSGHMAGSSSQITFSDGDYDGVESKIQT